jgi:phosphoglycolate phosphatase-like HAD superfamily hydrolase
MACDSHVTSAMSVSANKIFEGDGILVGYAGDWIAGEYFARHYLGEFDEKPERDSDDDLELLVLKLSGIYLVDYRFREVRICGKHFAIGSGAQAAMAAMNMGATAKEAVREAIKVDDYSAVKVRTITL